MCVLFQQNEIAKKDTRMEHIDAMVQIKIRNHASKYILTEKSTLLKFEK